MALVPFVSPIHFFFRCIHGVIKIKLGMGDGAKKGMGAFNSQDLILFIHFVMGFFGTMLDWLVWGTTGRTGSASVLLADLPTKSFCFLPQGDNGGCME
jgi:hypothetical protein